MNEENINRSLTSKELYNLLKKLGVTQRIQGAEAIAFLEEIIELDGQLGNPIDNQSIIDLQWFLLEKGVQIADEQNSKIIHNAIYNKENAKMPYAYSYQAKEEAPDTTSFLETKDNNIESCVEILMLELGLKPSLEGFTLFRDGVLYLLEKEEKILWTKEFYPMLGKKYNLTASKVERAIRNLINNGYTKHPDNEISRYVYLGKNGISNSECISSVVEYIKYNKKDIEDKIATYFPSNNNDIANMSLEQILSQTMHFLGISTHIKGYKYLQDAILYAIQEDGNIRGSGLYKKIASNYTDVSEASVCRTITSAILKSNKQYMILLSEDKFQSDLNASVVKFVNTYLSSFESFEFITLVSIYVKIMAKERVAGTRKTIQSNKPLAKIRVKSEI